MTPIRGTEAHAANSFNTAERLRAFMETYGLGVKELAQLLCTSPQTLEGWFEDGMAPPACLLALTLALGTPARAAKRPPILPNAPQTRSFGRTDAEGPTESDKEKALRMVRAI